MRIWRLLVVLMPLLLGGLPAGAATLDEARILYRLGDFLEAAEIAGGLGTAGGLALATRATVAQALYVAAKEDRPGLLRRAEAYAKRALALEPDNLEAHLQRVVAMGRKARNRGKLRSFFADYGGRARKLLDRAMEIGPDNAYTHATFGAWHAEIVGRAPRGIAKSYGASAEAAIAHFEKAMILDPANLVVRAQYADGLVIMGGKKFIDRAKRLYAQAIAMVPRDALEYLVRQKAQRSLAQMRLPAPKGQTSSK